MSTTDIGSSILGPAFLRDGSDGYGGCEEIDASELSYALFSVSRFAADVMAHVTDSIRCAHTW